MARLAHAADKELLAHAAAAAAALGPHAFLGDPKAALESLCLGLSPEKVAEMLAQGTAAHLHGGNDLHGHHHLLHHHHHHHHHPGRTIERFSPT
ncbi:hypothetical protein JRQ81_008277 [Phrynocephalus forsythii]|uniref:Uncharacterized protein n=1 Tax=Phrynocephalus forsythii TaxID=171643 RepID=A0A9Q1ATE6_9SAUR|nr:hypothetical protein JRQ81_008277 [Phrynocephalus forsythii]